MANIEVMPPIRVTAKQQLFHDAVAHFEEVGFGGARGPGKTFALGHEALRQSIEHPGNLGAVLRRDLVDLRDTTLETFTKCVLPPYVNQGLRVQQRGGLRPETWVEIDGAVSKIMWRDTKDEASLMSANLGWVAMDEAVEIAERFYLMISAALGRAQLANGRLAPAKLFWASNPGPGWCKAYFPVGQRALRRAATIMDAEGNAREINRVFIPAKASDNPNLDPFFESNLRAKYPPDWVRRFLDGDWDVFEGQVFTEFEDRHILTFLPSMGDIVTRQWINILTLDWGYRNPAAGLLVSIDYDGRFWVWREYYQAERQVHQVADSLHEMSDGIPLSAQLTDPAAIDQLSGVSLAEVLNRNHGFSFRGWIKRKHGPSGSIVYLKQLLHQGGIFIAPNCTNLIRELKNAQWKPLSSAREGVANEPEEMVDKDDHAIDALFGALEYWRMQSVERKPDEDALGRQIRRQMELQERGNQVVHRDMRGEPITRHGGRLRL